MKIYKGKLTLPTVIRSMSDGLWYKGADDKDFHYRPYQEPRPVEWEIRRMWGVSIFGLFIGIIRTRKTTKI